MKTFYKLKQVIEKPWWSFVAFALACFMFFGLTGKDIGAFLVSYEWIIDATKWSLIGGAFIFGVSAFTKVKRSLIDVHTSIGQLQTRFHELQKKFESHNLQPPPPNDPALFPDLNETALKKHVKMAVDDSPFPSDVKNIFLFNGSPFKYSLVVIVDATENSSKVGWWWDREAKDIFEDYFYEVYKNKPDRNYMNDWGTYVVRSLDDIEDGAILKYYKWLLYKR